MILTTLGESEFLLVSVMAVAGGSMLEGVSLALKNENKTFLSDVSEELFSQFDTLSSYLEAKKKKLVALRLRNED